MCDERTFADADRAAVRGPALTRREFGALSAGAGLSILLAGGAGAAEVTGRELDVSTPDGKADSYFVHPADGAPHPGVLIWPDAFGLRDAMERGESL